MKPSRTSPISLLTLSAVLCLALCSCSDDTTEQQTDSGFQDADASTAGDDGGAPADPGSDPGPADPGPPDAGQPDAGEDAGGVDAGTIDAGPGDGDESATDDGDFPDPEPDDCITDVSAGHHQFRCNGIRFETHVPAACLSGPCGLIFDLAGWGMNGDQVDAHTNMRALGETYGYIVVQPSSGYYPQGDVNVHDFMLRVMAAWHTDPVRVHVTGFSLGACQTWRFICQYADLIASVAPLSCGLVPSDPPCDVSGRQSCPFEGADMPVRQLHVLFAFGLNDNMGDFTCAERMRDKIIDVWNMQETEIVSQDADHTWTRYESLEGTVFEFIEHAYQASSAMLGGHCYPGSDGNYGCVGPNAFVWGEAAMQFFVEHQR